MRVLVWLACAAALTAALPSAVAAIRPWAAPEASADAKLWVSRYDGPGNGIDVAAAVGVSPDGAKVFATGRSTGPTSGDDYASVAYDAATGAKLWTSRYDGFASSTDYATGLAVSPDGSEVFVTGSSEAGGRRGADFATVAYDATTGARRWQKRYNTGLHDHATAVGVSPDGSKLFVTGCSGGAGDCSVAEYSTVAYDAATGTQLWAQHYNGPVHWDLADELAVGPDGSKVFVTGRSLGSDFDYATVAYDATTGTQLWVQRYDAGPSDLVQALSVSPDGSSVFVTGASSLPDNSYHDYATVAYDAATGSQLWVQRYSAPRANSDDFAYGLGVSPDGSKVFVTGRAFYGPSPANFDYTTIAYDATSGAQLWLKRYDAGVSGDDIASALGVSPDGSKLFVTGRSTGSTSGDDYATVAYDAATGGRLWTKRYNGPANGTDDGGALAVGPDGSNVFVTGRSQGAGSDFDYATVAYSAG